MTIAMEQAGMGKPVEVVKDGQAAREYMEGKGKYAERNDTRSHTLYCWI